MWEQKDKDYKDYGDYVEEGIEETRMNEKKKTGTRKDHRGRKHNFNERKLLFLQYIKERDSDLH